MESNNNKQINEFFDFIATKPKDTKENIIISIENLKKDLIHISFTTINETLECYFLPKYCKDVNVNIHCFNTNPNDKQTRLGELLQVIFI